MVVGTSIEKLKWCYFNDIVILIQYLLTLFYLKNVKTASSAAVLPMTTYELVLTLQCVGSTVRRDVWWPGSGVGDPSRPLTTATSRRDFYYFIIIIFLFVLISVRERATNPISATRNAVAIFSPTDRFFVFRAWRTSKHDELCSLAVCWVRPSFTFHVRPVNTTKRRSLK